MIELNFNLPELENLMKNFYTLTGIKMVLFDDEYHELLAYPANNCAFCKCMKENPATRKLCEQSDRHSFRTCQEHRNLIIYHCHAGLIEAAAPLIDNNTVIGYLMFGQIADVSSEEELEKLITHAFQASGLADAEPSAFVSDIPLKTGEQIQAAAKIMEACTFYVVFKETIRLRRKNFITNMNTFLNSHLSEDLSVETITRELGISKSKLYQVCADHLGCGIAEHVKSLRLRHARELLRTTDFPITRIAEECGFSDYNYFCRVFKKENGMPARKYREMGT